MVAPLREEIAKKEEELARAKDRLRELGKSKTDTTLREAATQISTVHPKLSCCKTLSGHSGRVYALGWAKEPSSLVVSTSQDGRLIVWDAVEETKQHLIEPNVYSQWVMTCDMSPNGHIVASGGLDNVCSIFHLPPVDTNASHSSISPSRMMVGHMGYISSCKFLSNNLCQIVTSSGDQSCILWDFEANSKISTFSGMTGHSNDIICLSLNEKEPSTFLSGSVDSTVKLWDMRSPARCAATFIQTSDVNSISFFENGLTFISGCEDGSVCLFDIRSRHLLQHFPPQAGITGGVTSVERSRSGRLVFTAFTSLHCLVWDTIKAEVVGQLDGHEGRVSAMGLYSDGSSLCTASWDSTLKIWTVDTN